MLLHCLRQFTTADLIEVNNSAPAIKLLQLALHENGFNKRLDLTKYSVYAISDDHSAY